MPFYPGSKGEHIGWREEGHGRDVPGMGRKIGEWGWKEAEAGPGVPYKQADLSRRKRGRYQIDPSDVHYLGTPDWYTAYTVPVVPGAFPLYHPWDLAALSRAQAASPSSSFPPVCSGHLPNHRFPPAVDLCTLSPSPCV